MSELKKVVYPLRMDSFEKRIYDLAAKARGMPLAKWVRSHLSGAAIDELGDAHEAVKAFNRRDTLPPPSAKKPAKKPKAAKKATK